MVAVRELNRQGLPAQAQTWVNQRLKFTHGYGATMALVAAVAEEGRPRLLVQDVPPHGEIPITRPEIYFGTRPSDYAIVRTTEAEFDYPRGDENVETRHAGGAGVQIGGLLSRLAFAIRLRDTNLLITGAIREDSELLWRRTVRERVERIAPFLLQDSDPYAVVADGQIYWILDAYTHTAAYPYSQPTFWQPRRYPRGRRLAELHPQQRQGRRQRLRRLGPVLRRRSRATRSSRRTSASSLTCFIRSQRCRRSLRAHVRYPEDLFKIQADRYLAFHMQDPTVFYNREDSWAVATEKVGNQSQAAEVEPYYVVMRLPGEAREEFLLMQPFTPVGRTNMIAWLAARSDEPNYGKLVVYKYPKDRLIFGPFQVEGRIDQDPTISAQFTLWSQAGTRVIRGNLLVIPLGASNLYVEPIYLQAENGPIPELKRVVVSTGNRVVMEPTLEEALAKLFNVPASSVPSVGSTVGSAQAAAPVNGQSDAQAAPAGGTAIATTELAGVIQSANLHYSRAQEALRTGDWARYGEEQRLLEADLQRLAELTR